MSQADKTTHLPDIRPDNLPRVLLQFPVRREGEVGERARDEEGVEEGFEGLCGEGASASRRAR
jgi:hypothetical protein